MSNLWRDIKRARSKKNDRSSVPLRETSTVPLKSYDEPDFMEEEW